MHNIMLGLRSDLLPSLNDYPNSRTQKLEFLCQAGIALTVMSSFFDLNYGCPRLAADKTLLSCYYQNVDFDQLLFDYPASHVGRDMHFIRHFNLEAMGCKASLDHADLFSRFFCSFRYERSTD